ncbi:DUF4870 domain-containing protein [Nocardioides xinjiangensis]|uniref:DUF4870 domain-containing protein n=1 Tax=Nocardioides xinjiangensis TaxID=2817376 RepID=UPI001B3053DF|nr:MULTISPECIES: DUF4870 domain-containing protein [unclassified Nocardioides]
MSDQHQSPYDPSGQQPGYGPQPDAYRAGPATMSPQDERTWGAISHGGALVAMICSAGFLGFVASVVVFMMYKDRGPFVRSHAANSINVQITMFIWIVISFPLILLLGLGLLTLVAAPFVAGLLHVIGAVKAYQGEWWNPPLTPRFVR